MQLSTRSTRAIQTTHAPFPDSMYTFASSVYDNRPPNPFRGLVVSFRDEIRHVSPQTILCLIGPRLGMSYQPACWSSAPAESVVFHQWSVSAAAVHTGADKSVAVASNDFHCTAQSVLRRGLCLNCIEVTCN